MPATTKLTPPLKWHGGKHYLAAKILALMPPHRHYVEPFAGGLSVLLAKEPRNVSEVINDLDGRVTNFWRVLQRRETFEKFQRIVELIPFSEVEWREARCWTAELGPDHKVHETVAFFVECRMSLAGRMESFSPLSRHRTRRGMNEQVSAWLTAVEGLAAVHRRLRRVAIVNRPALEVIRGQDGPDTLFYLDPPYLPSTRTAPDVYEHEMTEEDHRKLLEVLRTVRGKVMVSGYPSELYGSMLADWQRHTFDLPNHAAGTKIKEREQEIVWCNFDDQELIQQKGSTDADRNGTPVADRQARGHRGRRADRPRPVDDLPGPAPRPARAIPARKRRAAQEATREEAEVSPEPRQPAARTSDPGCLF